LAETVAELSIVIRARNAANAVLKKIGKDFGGLIKQAQKYRAELADVGKKLLLVGVAASALFIGSAVVFNNLEQEMANVRKTTGLTRVEISGLKKEFIDLSKRIPVSARELASIGAIAGQLGIQGTKNILSFTETVAQFATVTDFTAEEAAENLARLSNILKLPIRDVRRLAGVINELENTTTAKAPVIADFMQRIAVSGRQINLSTPAIAALSATLVDLGFKAELGGTAVSATFTKMISDADKFGKQMGLTAEEFRASLEKDAIGTIIKWAESIQNLPTEQLIAQFDEVGISGTRALQVFGALTKGSEKLKKNVKTANDEFKLGTSLLKEFSIFIATTWKQTEILRNKISALANFIGKTLNPAWLKAVEIGGQVTEFFDALDDSTKRNIVTFGLWVTSMALVIGSFSLVATAIVPLVIVLGALGVAATPIAVVLGAIALVTAIAVNQFVNLGEQSDKVKKKLEGQERALKFLTDEGKKLTAQYLAVTDSQKAVGVGLDKTTNKLAKVNKAFATLDLDSEKSIRDQIKKINDALETLRVSGVASVNELDRAEARAANQTRELFKALDPEKVEMVKTSFEKLTSALGEMDQAQLRVLNSQKELLSLQIDAAQKRVDGILGIIAVEDELAGFKKEIADRGFSEEFKNFRLIEGLQKNLKNINRVDGEERITQLRKIADEAKLAVGKFKDGSFLETAAIKLVEDALKRLSTELKKQGNINPGRKISLQLKSAEGVVQDLRDEFKRLSEEIANIEAVIRITNQEQLIAEATRLRSQIEDKFSTAIVQDVIIRQRFETTGQSINSSVGRTKNSTGDLPGFNLKSLFQEQNFPSFAKGIRFVPRDMTANIHQGEGVLTAQENREFLGGTIGSRTISFGDINIYPATSTEAPEVTARKIRAELQRIDERRSN